MRWGWGGRVARGATTVAGLMTTLVLVTAVGQQDAVHGGSERPVAVAIRNCPPPPPPSHVLVLQLRGLLLGLRLDGCHRSYRALLVVIEKFYAGRLPFAQPITNALRWGGGDGEQQWLGH